MNISRDSLQRKIEMRKLEKEMRGEKNKKGLIRKDHMGLMLFFPDGKNHGAGETKKKRLNGPFIYFHWSCLDGIR